MKQIFSWMLVLGLLDIPGLRAQPGQALIRKAPDTILPYSLAVTERYTTNLIFPFAIVKADLGSGEVIAQKWGKTENVLLLKAARAHFLPTNVSVYLANGALYSFAVSYSDTVSVFNFSFPRDSLPARSGSDGQMPRVSYSSGSPGNIEVLEEDAGLLRKAPAFMHTRAVAGKVRLELRGVYIKDSLLWVCLGARNRSPVPFRMGSMHFYIQDKRRVRHAAVQSIDVEPVYILDGHELAAGSQSFPLAAFKPFMLNPGKKWVVEWREGNGGRLIRLVIPARRFLKLRNCD